MLGLLCVGFADLYWTRIQREMKMKKIRLNQDLNPQPLAAQAGALDHSATLSDDELCLKVLYTHTSHITVQHMITKWSVLEL